VKNRVEFLVEYKFNCNNLNKTLNRNIMESMTEHNFKSIEEICTGGDFMSIEGL